MVSLYTIADLIRADLWHKYGEDKVPSPETIIKRLIEGIENDRFPAVSVGKSSRTGKTIWRAPQEEAMNWYFRAHYRRTSTPKVEVYRSQLKLLRSIYLKLANLLFDQWVKEAMDSSGEPPDYEEILRTVRTKVDRNVDEGER